MGVRENLAVSVSVGVGMYPQGVPYIYVRLCWVVVDTGWVLSKGVRHPLGPSVRLWHGSA